MSKLCNFVTAFAVMKGLFHALAAVVITTGIAHAGIVFTVEAPGAQSTTVAGATTETFDAVPLGIIGSYASPAIDGIYTSGEVIAADPYGGAGNTGRYDVIGLGAGTTLTTPQTLAFASGRTFFGFWWTAMDEANTVEFFGAGDVSLGSLNAVDVMSVLTPAYLGNPNTGQQSSHYFAYVNFMTTGGDLIEKVVFRGNNFETDNHAVVPGAPPVDVLDFESPLPNGLVPMSYLNGTLVPATARVTTQYLDHGIRIEGAALVKAGLGHAASGTNGLGGIDESGRLNYDSPVTFSFFSPLDGTTPATTNYFAYSPDLGGGSQDVITITAYDLGGVKLGQVSFKETGTFPVSSPLSISGFGQFHRVTVDQTLYNSPGGGIVIDLVRFGALQYLPPDETPPVITPIITGTLGNDGWYTSAVPVAWSVVDDESDVTSSTGCESTLLTNDTTGIALTCSATSEGGTSNRTVTVKIDATPPTLTGAASPVPNTAGWNNTPVLVAVYCTDNANGSGVSSSSNYAGGTVTGDGANQSLPSTGHCYDTAGNEASPATVTVSGIKIDRTVPTFGACTGGPFLYGSGPQSVSISATDALSGMDLPGSTLSGYVNANVLGSASLPYTAKDIAGNSSTKSCSYQVISMTFAFAVSKSGTGTGTVTSTPTGINCGTTCSFSFDEGTSVTLAPVAAAGSVFGHWTGACTGSGACVVTVNAAKSVGAVFNLQTFPLTVTKSGTGTGTVTSIPAGITCGATCSSSFNYGTSVTLTPKPDKASSFTGWGGACSGTGACVVSMDVAKTVSATFKKGTSGGRK